MRLLLDAHVPPAVAAGMKAQVAIEIEALRGWQNGAYLDEPDDVILQAAQAHGWVLITYDQRSIAPLLKEWGDKGKPHAGVMFVDDRAIKPHDVGGLIRALRLAVDTLGDVDWENRVHYLQPVR